MKKIIRKIRQLLCPHKNLASDRIITMVFCRDCEWEGWYAKGGDLEGFRRNRKHGTPLWSDNDGLRWRS